MNWFDENELPKITDINSLELAMGAVKARFNGHPHKFTRNDYLLFINTLYSIFTYLILNSGKLSRDVKSEYKPNVGFVPLNDVFTEGMNLTDVVEKIFLNPNPYIDTLTAPYIYREDCKDGYKEILINWKDSISNAYYTIDGTDILYDSSYNVTNGTQLVYKSDYHGYISITSDCTLKLIALPKPGCNFAPSLLALHNLYYDCVPAEKIKLDWDCSKIKESTNDCSGIHLYVDNSASLMNKMIVFFTTDGSDVDIVFNSLTNTWTNNSDSTRWFRWEGNAKVNLPAQDCVLKVVFAPAGEWVDTYAPSDLCEKIITSKCSNTFIVEGGIDPINKTYKEYDIFGDVINEIIILEGSAVPDLTDFCSQHEVLDVLRLASDKCYVVIPKNTTFKLYVPNNSLNINIIYSEFGLVGWPQSSTFTENYFHYFTKSGEDTIDGVLYNIYEYNNNGDIFFKIIN